MPKQYPTRASLHRPAPAGPVAADERPVVDDGARASLPTRAERRRREQAALEATALMAPITDAPAPAAPSDTPCAVTPSPVVAGGLALPASGAVAVPRWAPVRAAGTSQELRPAQPAVITPAFLSRAERRTLLAPAQPDRPAAAEARAGLPTPAAAFPSRAERRRAAILPEPAPEPAPASSHPDEPTTELLSRTARRAAEHPHAARRKAERAHRAHTGSLVAVAGALLVATVVVDPLSAAVPNDDDYRLVAEALEAIAERGGAASRAGDRVELTDEAVAAVAAATPAVEAVTAAQDVLDRAAAVVATESRATPAKRDEVVAQAAVVRELVNRLGAGDDVAQDPELVEVVDAKLTSAAVTAGKDASDAGDPEVLASAISTATAQLSWLLDAAAPVAVAVEPRPKTAAEVRELQAAEGRADAPRLEQYRLATAGFENGRLPMRIMSELSWAPGHFLRPDAAAQLERLNIAFYAEFGVNLSITDSYRSFEGQVRARRNRGRMAAIPGFSNHGWGVAVDLGGGINRFGTAEHRWMREHAEEFGWTLPGWARERGSKPEPWHWEFEGAPHSYGD